LNHDVEFTARTAFVPLSTWLDRNSSFPNVICAKGAAQCRPDKSQ
jgi:hypothetical protein